MLKVDFHTHTADDPVDFIPYTTRQLIDRAAELGFGALAVTLHDKQFETRELAMYARDRGLVLIPGVERTLQRRHVLLLNFPESAASIETFDDIARLKARHPEGLVVAPHPFYPTSSCLRGLMHRHAALFDAVEVNAFHTKAFNFNRAALRWARTHGKSAVGNSDTHRLPIFGKTFSLVDAEPNADAICAAVKSGRVHVQSRALSTVEAAMYYSRLLAGGFRASQSRGPLPEPA